MLHDEPKFVDFKVYVVIWMDKDKEPEEFPIGRDTLFHRVSFENYGLCLYGKTIRYVFPWHTIQEVRYQTKTKEGKS